MPIVHSLVGIFQNLIVSAAFLMLLIAIFYYISSGGDSKKVGKAKEFLLSAVTALVALVLVKMFLPGGGEVEAPEVIKQARFDINPVTTIMNAIKCPEKGCSTDALEIFRIAAKILTGITSLILKVIPIFALLMIMYSGLQYIFSASNPKKNEEAIKLLNSAVIGFAVSLMLYALWYFILEFIEV